MSSKKAIVAKTTSRPRHFDLSILLTRICILILLVVASNNLMSCQKEEKFDKTKWGIKTDIHYDYRNSMLTDLLRNYAIIGLKRKELISLLGKPDLTKQNGALLYYEIYVKYGFDVDPVYSRYLLIEMDKDSIITNVRVQDKGKPSN